VVVVGSRRCSLFSVLLQLLSYVGQEDRIGEDVLYTLSLLTTHWSLLTTHCPLLLRTAHYSLLEDCLSLPSALSLRAANHSDPVKQCGGGRGSHVMWASPLPAPVLRPRRVDIPSSAFTAHSPPVLAHPLSGPIPLTKPNRFRSTPYGRFVPEDTSHLETLVPQDSRHYYLSDLDTLELRQQWLSRETR
jgi:hypothetical protein